MASISRPGYIVTGIPELDRMLGEGSQDQSDPKSPGVIPVGSIVLIRGEPGSGKTTLALQIMNAFLDENERGKEIKHFGNLISLEEKGKTLIERLDRAYGFSLSQHLNTLDGKTSALAWATADDVHAWIRKMVATESDAETAIEGIGKELEELMNQGVTALATGNGVAVAVKVAALLMCIPKKAQKIIEKSEVFTRIIANRKAQALQPPNLQKSCLLIVDSLNAFINIAAECFPARRHPRVMLNTFCRILSNTFGPTTTVILTSEYHYHIRGMGEMSESFFCDIEIVLRPEPVRVPASYEPSIQAPVGYNLNALLSDTSKSMESRSFCRVIKSRPTQNQSRRCTYDIVSQEGIKLYPTYPGDGKLVLFAENQPQRDSWETFFTYDVPESYPALRTGVFNRMSLQTVFEGQRRLHNIPLRTDMYLASFDSYWVSWYWNYKLKADIQVKLNSIRQPLPAGAIQSEEDRERYGQLVNSLMRVLRHSNREDKKGREDAIGWKDIADHLSLSYFAKFIEDKFGDGTPQQWIKIQHRRRNELIGDPVDEGVDGTLNERQIESGSSFLKVVNELREDAPGSSFLTPLPSSGFRLFGEKRSDFIKELAEIQNRLLGMTHKQPGESGNHSLTEEKPYVPYDANFGLFVCRRDFLEHADLEEDDALGLLTAVVERERDLCVEVLSLLISEVILDTITDDFRSDIPGVEEVDDGTFDLAKLSKRIETCLNTVKDARKRIQSVSKALKHSRNVLDVSECDKRFRDLSQTLVNRITEFKKRLGDADAKQKRPQDLVHQVRDHVRESDQQLIVLRFLMPGANGRRSYRFRVFPMEPENLLRHLILMAEPGDRARRERYMDRSLDPCYPEDLADRANIRKTLNDALDDDLSRNWLLARLRRLQQEPEDKRDRSIIAEALETACRIRELKERLDAICGREYAACTQKMVEAAAKRICAKRLPKTWEEVIVTSRMLGRTVQIEWQTFDSFVCSFLEVLWSCGGSSIVVDEDYQLRVISAYDDKSTPSRYAAPDNAWDAGFIQMLRACHIMHELYWQRIAPKSVVTTHKPRAFHRGVAGSKDWVFARHWYSTLIELLTAKDDEGNLLYPDEPAMRLHIMQIPVSLGAWAQDLQSNSKVWEGVKQCESGFGCCEDADAKYDEKETADQLRTGRVSYEPKDRTCRMNRPKTKCGGCPRPVSFSCWGEWSFGLLKGSENKALAVDLINNMMSSIKIMQRAFSGACVPAVEDFYEMYGDLPCMSIPERTEETLPKNTYNELRRMFFTTAKSRQEIYDFRHCGKILHSKLEMIRKSPGKMESIELIRLCADIFREIQDLYSSDILLRREEAYEPPGEAAE